VLSEQKTPLQIASEHGLHVKTLNGWVHEAREKMSGIFKGEIQQPEVAAQKEIERLHQKIGQLTVEIDFLKKVSGKWQ
jgi:transposase